MITGVHSQGNTLLEHGHLDVPCLKRRIQQNNKGTKLCVIILHKNNVGYYSLKCEKCVVFKHNVDILAYFRDCVVSVELQP